jgi:hypothetical protein
MISKQSRLTSHGFSLSPFLFNFYWIFSFPPTPLFASVTVAIIVPTCSTPFLK